MMKRIYLILVIAICFFQCEQQPSGDYQASLNQAIDKFNSAFETGDYTTLSRMITEEYLHTNNSWKAFGKDKWLGYMKDRSEKIKDGSLQISSYTLTEKQIQFYGNTTVVTGLVTSEGTEDGLPFSKEFRVTNVWVHLDNSWKRAAFQDTWMTD